MKNFVSFDGKVLLLSYKSSLSLQSTMTSNGDVSLNLTEFNKIPLYTRHFVSFAFPKLFTMMVNHMTSKNCSKIRGLIVHRYFCHFSLCLQ